METERRAIPITDADLDALKDKAEQIITRIKGEEDLESIYKALSPNETYRTLPVELQLVYDVRHATCLYIWVGKWLFIKTGQQDEAAKSSIPTDSILKKQKFSSAYSLFVMASYIVKECDKALHDKTELATINPNFKLDIGRNFTTDLLGVFSYYVDALRADDNGISIIKKGDDIVSVSRDFWKAVATRALAIAQQADADIQSVVGGVTFKHNEFTISGFSLEETSTKSVVSFVPVQPDEVVGNHESVIMLLRLADRIALYDLMVKKNPMCELGGVYESNLLDGPPGTGKTTLQRMAITRLAMRAEQVGIPFQFRSLEAKDIKSEWYGKSGKMLAEIITSVLDPEMISLLLVDDIDLLISNRDDPGTGGADKDLLKGLMDFFSGIGTNYKGNYSSVAATNKPTGVDDALRQRFVYRVMVTGAESWEDYVDLVALQLKKPLKYGLVKIDTKGYIPLSRKRPTLLAEHKRIYNKSSGWEDIGHEILNLHSKDESFTARSVKNAMDVVVAQAGDFEVPDDWFAKPDVFLKQSWETKINMIKELFGTISADAIINSITEQFNSEVRYNEIKYVNKK